MLCVTLTLANSVPAAAAEQTVGQLVASLSEHPDAIGGPVAGFKTVGQRQVQGCLAADVAWVAGACGSRGDAERHHPRPRRPRGC